MANDTVPNPLTWNVPIANKDGTPTNEFMRKWGQINNPAGITGATGATGPAGPTGATGATGSGGDPAHTLALISLRV